MLAVSGDRVGSVDRFITFGGQVLSLWLAGPMRKVALFAAVHAAHLLQANQVGIQLLHSMPQVVYLQPARGPQALNTFVNVVGGHSQNRVFVGLQHV